ncbi:MAG TPA: ATP-binding protein, partial [Symbiobacteriaceae bacterium]|nr:ATP-binding protein [Symbiobacteriaceae bacterium]
ARRVGGGDLGYRIAGGGRDELGRLITAFNAMTGRLQAQSDALRQERDRLDTVVSSVGAGLALIDPAGQVLWVNRTLSEWFPETLMGRPCREVLGRKDCAGCGGAGGQGCLRDGAEQEVLVHGRPRLLRYTAYTLEGEARPGEPYRLEVLEDVTERRAMEAMVRQSEKLAAVGQLAAGVAHEINNPLAVIQAYAEDLDDRLKEEGATALDEQGELSAYLQQLQVQVRRCKGITTNLLDFARRGPAEPEPVDLAGVVRATAALMGARARRAGVRIRCDLPEGLPPVRATRDELQQVFLNLMTNALDAMEETGPGTITVTGAPAGPAAMQVAVADTGPGMDAATLARAMEPFFTTKPPGRGTGLGLSTCYGILTGLGGQMSLTSQPGAGTTVSLQLPLWGENGAELVAADR